jgi:hypothetical protein
MKIYTPMIADKAETIPGGGAALLHRPTFLLMLLALIALVLLSSWGSHEALAAHDDDDDENEVALNRLGKPCFKPVDFHLFSANVELFSRLIDILPNHKPHPNLGVGPGAPHDPPYDEEIKDGLNRLGIRDQKSFSPEDFSDPNVIFFTFMVVAQNREGCPRGSSPDFTEGPIIPNSLFPGQPDTVLSSRTTFFRNNQVFDPAFVVDVPRLDKVDPPFLVAGHSHLPIFLATAKEFGAGGQLEGNYRINSVLLDQAGNGWDITKRFKIR